MGMAHGMASIMVILSKLLEVSPDSAKLNKLIDGSLKFYYDNKLPNDCLSVYPYKSDDIRIKRSCRLAWCYGDPGIANSLYLSSKSIANNNMLNHSLSIYSHAAKRRDLIENLVMDAGFCHGSAGLVHVFNRAYHRTKDPIYMDSANFWIGQTLKMAKYAGGIAGFKTWQNESKEWINSYSLLDGVSGIGLALISAVSDIEPKWDESVLLS